MARVSLLGVAVWLSCTTSLAPSPTPPSAPPAATAPATTPAAAPTTAAPTAALTAAATARPPTPLALSGDISVRGTKVPAEFRYLPGAETGVGRIWLADLASGAAVDVVAARTLFPTSPSFSATRDGRQLLVAGVSGSSGVALYLIDIEAGKASSLYEGPEWPLSPVISPDGSRYAHTVEREVRMADAASRATIRVVPHVDGQQVGGSWLPLGWSPDGKWLAIGRASELGSEVAIADAAGALVRVGSGHMVSWRSRPPELVVMEGRGAFGGRSGSSVFDLTTRRATALEATGSELRGALAWHPTEDRFVYIAAADLARGGEVRIRALGDRAPTKVAVPRSVDGSWWSADGSKVYALMLRQDALVGAPGAANYEVVELPSGRVVATVCRGDPRATCP